VVVLVFFWSAIALRAKQTLHLSKEQGLA